MKIELPLETWTDLLAFVPRHQLGALFFHTGDRQLVSILQFCFNEFGVFIGYLLIVPPWKKDAMLKVWRETEMAWSPRMDLPEPDVPMPTYVKNFKAINLSDLDMSVVNFLQKYQQNALLTNVNLSIPFRLNKECLLPFLTHILPLIDSINSINLGIFAQVGQINNRRADSDGYSRMMWQMLARTRILEIRYNNFHIWRSMFHWYCGWLYTPRDDAKPRVLLIFGFSLFGVADQNEIFIARIEEDFLQAILPVSFFIRLEMGGNFWWHNISLENGRTNEKLVIKKIQFNQRSNDYGMLISRYPMDASDKWIEENEKEILDWDFPQKNRQINLEENMTIGDFSSPNPSIVSFP